MENKRIVPDDAYNFKRFLIGTPEIPGETRYDYSLEKRGFLGKLEDVNDMISTYKKAFYKEPKHIKQTKA